MAEESIMEIIILKSIITVRIMAVSSYCDPNKPGSDVLAFMMFKKSLYLTPCNV